MVEGEIDNWYNKETQKGGSGINARKVSVIHKPYNQEGSYQ